MVELPDGTVLVVKGERLPARCLGCEGLFPFSEDGDITRVVCPHCGDTSDLSDQRWAPVKE
jgi:hypothetical protein